eukprot:364047-Chlamydomonas_euryale.AAC.2
MRLSQAAGLMRAAGRWRCLQRRRRAESSIATVPSCSLSCPLPAAKALGRAGSRHGGSCPVAAAQAAARRHCGWPPLPGSSLRHTCTLSARQQVVVARAQTQMRLLQSVPINSNRRPKNEGRIGHTICAVPRMPKRLPEAVTISRQGEAPRGKGQARGGKGQQGEANGGKGRPREARVSQERQGTARGGKGGHGEARSGKGRHGEARVSQERQGTARGGKGGHGAARSGKGRHREARVSQEGQGIPYSA